MNKLWKIAICTIFILSSACCELVRVSAAPRRPPFTGNWVSLQYTNGKEFRLKIEQIDRDNIIGWEGKLPPNMDKLAPDFKGTINKGKYADLQVQHRRGYQAHAQLRLQGDKLVWQLMESDGRSSRYFPLASTLNRQDTNPEAAQMPATNAYGEQPMWGILIHAESFDSEARGESVVASPYFGSYKALISTSLKPDDISLQSLLKCNSPAGRLYAAAILWELGHEEGLQAFKSLTADNSVVQYKSGDEVSGTTVAEVAHSYIETGSFRDFPSKKY